MKENILEGHDFLLGVQESWDAYEELMVHFIRELTVGSHTFHLFEDQMNRAYLVQPRYRGYRIEGVLVEQRIFVNIFRGDLSEIQRGTAQPEFYATGLLACKENL